MIRDAPVTYPMLTENVHHFSQQRNKTTFRSTFSLISLKEYAAAYPNMNIHTYYIKFIIMGKYPTQTLPGEQQSSNDVTTRAHCVWCRQRPSPCPQVKVTRGGRTGVGGGGLGPPGRPPPPSSHNTAWQRPLSAHPTQGLLSLGNYGHGRWPCV